MISPRLVVALNCLLESKSLPAPAASIKRSSIFAIQRFVATRLHRSTADTSYRMSTPSFFVSQKVGNYSCFAVIIIFCMPDRSVYVSLSDYIMCSTLLYSTLLYFSMSCGRIMKLFWVYVGTLLVALRSWSIETTPQTLCHCLF
jgi:hypothetical protein